MNEFKPDTNGTEDDSKFRKWGVFYYNPGDKNLWHSKRNKDMGLTINCAHPSAKYFLGALALIILGVVLFVVYTIVNK